MLTPDYIRKALRAVKDPELNLNIVDLGLVYDIEVSEDNDVHVRMTLDLSRVSGRPGDRAGRGAGGRDLEEVGEVEVEIVWEPYWTPERIDPRVRAFLGG